MFKPRFALPLYVTAGTTGGSIAETFERSTVVAPAMPSPDFVMTTFPA